MRTVWDLHQEAMGIAFEADHSNETEHSRALYANACRLEREALLQIPYEKSSEPTRSILFLSAASLANLAGDIYLAKQLLHDGLRGWPPPREAHDLQSLLEEIAIHEHLEYKKIQMDESELTMVLHGPEAHANFTKYSLLKDRLDHTTRILSNTFLRQMNIKWEHREKKTPISKPAAYISTAEAASFSITVRLAYAPSKREPLPILQIPTTEVIDDFLYSITLYEKKSYRDLEEHFGRSPYLVDFIAHAKKLSPDGERITSVGFASRNSKSLLLRMSDQSDDITIDRPEPTESEQVKLRGTLEVADRGKGIIKLKAEDNKQYTIPVAKGMEDFVRSYFGRVVVVTGYLFDREIRDPDFIAAEDE